MPPGPAPIKIGKVVVTIWTEDVITGIETRRHMVLAPASDDSFIRLTTDTRVRDDRNGSFFEISPTGSYDVVLRMEDFTVEQTVEKRPPSRPDEEAP